MGYLTQFVPDGPVPILARSGSDARTPGYDDVARIALLMHNTTPPETMYPPTQNMEHPTYRHPPTFGMMLLFAALPLAVLVAATFPTATAGLFAGVATGAALQR